MRAADKSASLSGPFRNFLLTIEEMAAAALEYTAFDDAIADEWVRGYDSAWLEQDWDRLRLYLAPEVELVSPDFCSALLGRAAVMESWRALMSRWQVHKYELADLNGYRSGPVAIVTYRWRLDRTFAGRRSEITGRDVLILRRASNSWQLVWRAQVEVREIARFD